MTLLYLTTDLKEITFGTRLNKRENDYTFMTCTKLSMRRTLEATVMNSRAPHQHADVLDMQLEQSRLLLGRYEFEGLHPVYGSKIDIEVLPSHEQYRPSSSDLEEYTTGDGLGKR